MYLTLKAGRYYAFDGGDLQQMSPAHCRQQRAVLVSPHQDHTPTTVDLYFRSNSAEVGGHQNQMPVQTSTLWPALDLTRII